MKFVDPIIQRAKYILFPNTKYVSWETMTTDTQFLIYDRNIIKLEIVII